jgi:hypothetical protein
MEAKEGEVMSRKTGGVATVTAVDNTTTMTSVVPFTLKLPAELDIKPKWQVPVSKNYTANVYELDTTEYNQKTGEKIGMKKHYKVSIRHNRSNLPSNKIQSNDYYARDGFETTYGVMRYLENCALILQPKTKTVTVEQDED